MPHAPTINNDYYIQHAGDDKGSFFGFNSEIMGANYPMGSNEMIGGGLRMFDGGKAAEAFDNGVNFLEIIPSLNQQ